MADASDSKSDEGDFVRVQVPPSALDLNCKPPVNPWIYRGFAVSKILILDRV